VFVDSEKDTWNLCPESLEEAIIDRLAKGKKPKAIIPVHLYGMPAKMKPILDIADKYQIPVLEDAAEALGSAYMGSKCGTLGEMACLSFNGNKIITTSGGGALVTKTEENSKKAKFLATQAKDDAPHYEHTHIGYNYRMSNLVAGLGRGQMEVLDQWIEKRRNNFNIYKEHLSVSPGISFQEEQEGMFSNRWLTSILVDSSRTNGITREDLRLALQSENIETRPLWKPMHQQPIFSTSPYYGTGVSDKLFENGLCLPSSSSLTGGEIERVINAIKALIK
ncbi:DegT/DnrJ/EryC1/StrS family aminotransferase, partial [Arachidicoccus sp.]|uniref:DegT/DnrJ/EryC1/StrS family aminotransferase n=1 Tax=Arachidicoccus sp. TaxID=1872624 RepID=UPI003D1D56BD